ncbi:hypothetical protein VB712_12845 [Spirulina sp. CCNP1310]|uniref:hypothetical protein n=1 Tax=Spirulina sp. CCNP1310 TaxID=3110249 RepID=UPI002B218AE1|nr:hypothetical protein [Spirulina sp. CCNP1310]MEA5420111.1 hypothetical protein [Spirulina sp. CCNP1310]
MNIPEPLLQNLKLYLYGRRAAHDAEAEHLLKQLEEAIALAPQNPTLISTTPPDQGLGC